MRNDTKSDNNLWSRQFNEIWGIEAPLCRLNGEYDLNFLVEEASGSILKVMHKGCEASWVEMQINCLDHLAINEPNLNTPHVILTSDGRRLVEMTDEEGESRFAWLISKLSGLIYSEMRPQTFHLIKAIGSELGRIDTSLTGFEHPALDRPLKWDLQSPLWARDNLKLVKDHTRATLLSDILDRFEMECLPILKRLPKQAIHNDLNDYNILCETDSDGEQKLTGFIDFGDMIRAPAICDLAIAGAYIMLDQQRPVEAFAQLTKGYHAVRPLLEEEVNILWLLALTRLVVSALNAEMMRMEKPGDPYVMISQGPINRFFNRLPGILEAFVQARLRNVVEMEMVPGSSHVTGWIRENADRFSPVFDTDLSKAPILDLSVAGEDAQENPLQPKMAELETAVARKAPAGAPVLGRYAEPRLIYGSPAFFTGDHPATDRRTIHTAIDVFLPAKTPVHAPFDGVVHSVEICPDEYDYGGLVTLKHQTDEGVAFYTLYGHLSHDVKTLTVGQSVVSGEVFARLGTSHENGGWPPHVHFQLGLLNGPGSLWPGAIDPEERHEWAALCPDPAILLGLPAGHATTLELDKVSLLARRKARTAKNLKLFYDPPLTVLRGWRSLLFDDLGRTYLDAFNNVPHVGHSHPRITKAIHKQIRLVNTNTRYLQPAHEAYADALVTRIPDPLNVCFLLNSASEANELALRLTRTYTGAKDIIVSKSGYHGNTCSAIDISDYKFSGKGGEGQKDWVHVVPNPDTYRGPYGADDPDTGTKYATSVLDITKKLEQAGHKLAGFISEPFPSVGGQIIPPKGYLKAVYTHVRKAGGLCIADEVQTGLGRLGRCEWGFEQQGALPDIVVLGKPIGNGYPLAALVTTQEIADRFDNGMEFFSTFGGSTLSCVVGLEVLHILDDEALPLNAEMVGKQLLEGLRLIASETPSIGDVRGLGFFLGVEMIEPDGSPSPKRAAYIVNRLYERRILIGSDGPYDNVLKIRPPLCFSVADAQYFLEVASEVFRESPLHT